MSSNAPDPSYARLSTKRKRAQPASRVDYVLLSIGVVLVCLPLVFVATLPERFADAQLFLRLVASLGGALVGATVPGLLEIKLPGIRAAGALGVLVLFWQFNPPQQLRSALVRAAVIERTFQFPGPFRIGRSDDRLTFSLTDARVQSVPNGELSIEEITVSADVASESSEAFGFDQELLVFRSHSAPMQAIRNGGDYDQLQRLRNAYISSKRVVQITIRTDTGRAVRSADPITWSLNLKSGLATAGEVKAARETTIPVSDSRLFAQLFLWTLWGGDHFIELRNVKIQVRMQQK